MVLQIIHQSLIFSDQFWTPVSSATLDFEKSQYQFSGSLHDYLQEGTLTIDNNEGGNCSKLLGIQKRR